MECRSCGRTLDDDARFCPGCGIAVVRACTACGEALEPDARFCKHCGQSAAGPAAESIGGPPTSASPSTRERKIATLLFADVVGFTELSERLDAEVVSRLISEAFERLAAEVERYGGMVEKYAGDAMLAVFGVPVTHEDDPERAVRAALEMGAAMAALPGIAGDRRIQLRIGIESGEVLADLARSTEERDLFVTGDAVNTAARLQASAEAGTVVVGPTTYASTRGLIEYEERPTQSLKGKQLPIASWRAVRVRARRGGIRAPLGIEAPLIGRDEELALLKETIRRTVAAGRPHMVTVAGEAGVGKTRLIWELEKYLDGLPDTFYWRKGRCYSYASVSYSPLVEAVKADASISEDDSPGVMAQKLDARLDDLVDATTAHAWRPALQALLGLPGARSLAQEELFETWRLYLAALTARYPLVLVVEDIHWADDVTLDFLEFVARWGDAPITLLCIARPELLERRSTWGGGIRNAALVELAPLEAEESVALIDELLGGALPDDVRERVVAMAHGNPLFTEELVRMFVDQGVLREHEGAWQFVGPVTELSVPSSVQAVLSARLDELASEEKRVAQEAAVVGRIFWDVIVAHLRSRPADEVAQALRGLRVKELVAPRVPSTMAGASEWSFHHVLVRDVAYDSLPKTDRSSLHLQVARWAELALSDRLDEYAELVASHTAAALRYEEELATGDDGPSLSALREQTLVAAQRAARRAGAVQDRQAARRWQLLAIEQAKRLGRPAMERAELAQTFFDLTGHELDSAERVTLFSEAASSLEPIDHADVAARELWGRLSAYLGQAVHEDGRPAEAETLLSAAAEKLAPFAPSAARAKVLQTLSWSRWHAFEFDAAEVAAAAAMEEARASSADDVYRWALHEAGVIAGFRGDVAASLDRLRESHDLAEAAEDNALLYRCYTNISSVSLNSGYPLHRPRELLARATTLARRSASYGTLAFVLDNFAGLSWLQARFEDAVEQADEALDACDRAGYGHMKGTVYRVRSESLSALGRHHEATADLAIAVERAEDDPQHRDWLKVAVARADLLVDPARAVAGLRGPHPEFEGYPNAEMTVALWLARLAFRVGDREALAESLETQARHPQLASPGYELERRWARALADDDIDALAEASAGFDDTGYTLYMAETLIDAALIEARRGAENVMAEQARAAVERLDYHPILGALPETRWISGVVGRSEGAGTT